MEYEKHKKRHYKDIDRSKYIFIPFVVETCGGMGAAAEAFCKELASQWQKKQCKSVGEMNADKTDFNFRTKLLCSLSIVVQRANSRMIIERAPMPTTLIMKRISQCELAVAKEKGWASRKLKIKCGKLDDGHYHSHAIDLGVEKRALVISSDERWDQPKVSYFFISLEKFVFHHFWAKFE